MNIKLVILIISLISAYNFPVNASEQTKPTIRQLLEQKQKQLKIDEIAIEADLDSKYPHLSTERKLTEVYKTSDEQFKNDFQKATCHIMQDDLTNKILTCMDKGQSNNAATCFFEESFKINTNFTINLQNDEKFLNDYLAIFRSAQQEVAQIIFNPKNN